MQQNLNKQLIQKSFFKSINSYDRNAIVQKSMAKELVDKLLEHSGIENFSKVLEIGCGTGLLTKSLLHNAKIETYYLNDIVSECGEFIKSLGKDYPNTKFHFINKDAEAIGNVPDLLDLIVSNAVFQWLNDLKPFIEKLFRFTSIKGYLAFSTFGQNNLQEINIIEKKSLNYFSKDEIIFILKEYFEILYCSEEIFELQFDSPKEVLRHLKYTGTKGLQKEIWTKGHLLEFEDTYNSMFRKNNKVSLTYNPIYIIAKRR